MFGEIEVLFDKFTTLSTNLKYSFKTSNKFIYQLTHKKGQNSLLSKKVQVQSTYHVIGTTNVKKGSNFSRGPICSNV